MDALTNAMDNFNALNPVIVSAVYCQCLVCHTRQLVDANEAVVNHAHCTGAICHRCGSNSVKPITKKAYEKSEAEQRCRVCGCTDNQACMTDDGACYWVEPDLCSACVSKEACEPRRSIK